MKKQLGFNMVEIMLVIVVGTGLLGAIWGVNGVIKEKIQKERIIEQTRKTIQTITDSSNNSQNFESLTTQRALSDGAFDNNVSIYQDRILTPWGGEVSVAPEDVVLDGTVINSGGWALIYQNLPSEYCVSLLSELGITNYSVFINDQKVPFDNDGKPKVSAISEMCNDGNKVNLKLSMQKAFLRELLPYCEAPPGPRTRSRPCDSPGMTGEVKEEQTGTCPNPNGEVQWSDWVTVGDSCGACPAPETRTGVCPTGEYGTTYQKREFNCDTNQWKDWVTQTASCQPCESNQTRISACPNGQVGTIKEERVFFCMNGQWGPWQIVEQYCDSSGTPRTP